MFPTSTQADEDDEPSEQQAARLGGVRKTDAFTDVPPLFQDPSFEILFRRCYEEGNILH